MSVWGRGGRERERGNERESERGVLVRDVWCERGKKKGIEIVCEKYGDTERESYIMSCKY